MSKSSNDYETAEQHVKGIRWATRKQYSAEEKIRIVIEGLRGEHSIAELCRREGIAQSLYYGLCCKPDEGVWWSSRTGGRLMILRWPDGPAAAPWPRSERTVLRRRHARRSSPRR